METRMPNIRYAFKDRNDGMKKATKSGRFMKADLF